MSAHWKTARRSLYYHGAPQPKDPLLVPGKVALLVIDVQNTYLERPDPAGLDATERARFDAWTPFHERMRETVIPNLERLIGAFRQGHLEVLFARIACQKAQGGDRSLSQKKPGWNNLLLPADEHASQVIDRLAPAADEIVVMKTTDSALTGTNLRLTLHNLGITQVVCAGLFTDQCVSSTVRSLADESFEVIVIDDASAAGSLELHDKELEILNLIYCNVMNTDELLGYLP